MTAKKKNSKKIGERPIFDSLRKPIAPPSRTIGKRKPEDKANPVGRKIKHKKQKSPDE